jgi:hypothetical protein
MCMDAYERAGVGGGEKGEMGSERSEKFGYKNAIKRKKRAS